MTFELEFLDGKRAVPRQLLSYRWSGDVTAGCDGLRLHFLWDGDLPEVYRVRGFAPDGACCFFGYADQQKLTVTPGQRRGFVYARSSACLLLDNEALPISLNAPNVDQMVHHYAAPFGFTAALPAGTAPGQYTVEKGTSCFGALQGFMQVLGAKGVFADPENRLCVYGSEAPVTLPGDQITSITAVTERGEAPGVYAYKIASAEPYCRRLEAGYFADKKISRRRYVNVAAYPPEQRQQVLLRKLEQAAARYRRLEVVLTGAHRLRCMPRWCQRTVCRTAPGSAFFSGRSPAPLGRYRPGWCCAANRNWRRCTMWLNERARQTGGAGYECAGVTLGGSQVETVASAHLRETPVYAPYGYAANVPAGAQVLLLSGGEDGAVVAGARMGSTDLAPGEVELRGPGGAVVRLCRDGTVRINGLVINEKGEIEP